MSSKTKTQATYQQLPVTPQVQQLQSDVSSGSADPSIPYAYAQRRQDVQNAYQNPLGAYTTPAVRDASERVANQRMSIDEAAAQAASQFQAQGQRFGQQATVAGLTQPVNTSTTTTTPFSWGNLLGSAIGAGGQIGAAAMTGGGSAAL